jgi:cation-transporting P-type ATPase J
VQLHALVGKEREDASAVAIVDQTVYEGGVDQLVYDLGQGRTGNRDRRRELGHGVAVAVGEDVDDTPLVDIQPVSEERTLHESGQLTLDLAQQPAQWRLLHGLISTSRGHSSPFHPSPRPARACRTPTICDVALDRGLVTSVDANTVILNHSGQALSVATHVPHTAGLGREVSEIVRELEADACTVVVVTVDGVPAAVLALADRVRPGAREAVARLGVLIGRTPVLLTGDNEAAARRVAFEVGITDVRAGLLPSDKAVSSPSCRPRASVSSWSATA